jgi:DNA-binding GntR family transcriptional regulator
MVTAQLREDILGGVLQQGERLRLVDLGARFGVSQSVVREALTRLTAQGLVRSEPQVGFQVMPISEADLGDLTAVRIEIESLTIRQAVRDASLDWEGSVVAAHHVLARTPQMSATDPARMSDEWAAAHRLFHQAILDGCASPRLRAIASGLRDAAALYQRWSRNLARDETRDVAAEHQELLDAVLARDADRAVACVAMHIQGTTDALLLHLRCEAGQSQEAAAPRPADPVSGAKSRRNRER